LFLASPNEFMHMPIENLLLEELPDCQTGASVNVVDSDSETYFEDGSTNNLSFWPPTPSAFDTNSPYVAAGVAVVLLTAITLVLVIRYVFLRPVYMNTDFCVTSCR
jgi:hypothetical protein